MTDRDGIHAIGMIAAGQYVPPPRGRPLTVDQHRALKRPIRRRPPRSGADQLFRTLAIIAVIILVFALIGVGAVAFWIFAP